MRVNVGCGQTPTSGWTNLDNSPSLRLAGWPLLARLGAVLGLIAPEQAAFIHFARERRIVWADGSQRLPCGALSVEILYSSHMLEHLDHEDARRFLAEALRVLRPGGILRLAVPDLRLLVERYLQSGDADTFVAETLLANPRPRSVRERLQYLLVGSRHHRWLYDAGSLCRLLVACGFVEPVVQPAGSTQIPNPGPLDLCEREAESLYVEALKPR